MHFVCVGTPQKHGEYAADMSYVDAAIDVARPAPATATCLVVGKSTVPVGTAERLADTLAELAPAAPTSSSPGTPSSCARASPSRTRCTPTGSCSASRTERAEKVLREVYATPLGRGIPLVVTDFPTAELVKVAANAFLATKISFINAMAEVCEAAGADVTQLAQALGLRRPHRRPVPARRASASAAAACPRTSARSWPAPASSARTRR